mmetsp:Transcript_70763/g.169402  ORF Transcript_70763/g.169402 Transcript_70763/m.169402 type:complete len:646 (+) Transcript_70763:85-2022(+)
MGQSPCAPLVNGAAAPWRFASLESGDTYTGLRCIQRALQGKNTVLLHGRWLAELASSHWLDWFGVAKNILPRRQELPQEAIWDPEDLLRRFMRRGSGNARIVAISHCWQSAEHPDPGGRHLRTLCKAIRLWYEHFSQYSWELAIFIDWCSLPQNPRTPQEEQSFAYALEDVHLWYAHPCTDVWLLPNDFQGGSEAQDPSRDPQSRGWITFELALASLSSVRSVVLDLGKMDSSCSTWDALEIACALPQAPAKSPAAVAAELEGKYFSVDEDLHFVSRTYAMTCRSLLAYATELHLASMHWAEEDLMQLAEALPLCFCLQMLFLGDNHAGDRGARAIAAALPSLAYLHTLELQNNCIGLEGALALAAALPKCGSLVRLDLAGNDIGDSGVAGLSTALVQCRGLAGLILDANNIGYDGCHELTQVLPLFRSLQRLSLCGNDIGDEAVIELAAAVPRCRSLRHLLLDQSCVGDEGCCALSNVLVKCKGIETLRLAGNGFGVIGASSLAEAIPSTSSLARLAIGGTAADESVKIVADAWVAAGRPSGALVNVPPSRGLPRPFSRTELAANPQDPRQGSFMPSSWATYNQKEERPSDAVISTRSCLAGKSRNLHKKERFAAAAAAALGREQSSCKLKARTVSWSDEVLQE